MCSSQHALGCPTGLSLAVGSSRPGDVRGCRLFVSFLSGIFVRLPGNTCGMPSWQGLGMKLHRRFGNLVGSNSHLTRAYLPLPIAA